MAELFKTVIVTEDGMQFNSKAEALDYLRKPKVIEELNKITENSVELSEWIYERQELLENIFSTGTIQRVTKSDKKALEKALDTLKEMELPKACNFLVENAGAIMDSFRWPTVKRMEDDEKTAVITTSLMAATENDKELVDWIIARKEAIFAAFDAGKIKREVNPKATEALALYRAQKAAEKAEKEAAKAAEAVEDAPTEEVVEAGSAAEAVKKDNAEAGSTVEA